MILPWRILIKDKPRQNKKQNIFSLINYLFKRKRIINNIRNKKRNKRTQKNNRTKKGIIEHKREYKRDLK